MRACAHHYAQIDPSLDGPMLYCIDCGFVLPLQRPQPQQAPQDTPVGTFTLPDGRTITTGG